MSKFTITVDYGATGEGRTLIIYYVIAMDRKSALGWFIKDVAGGDWYAQGADIKEGFDFDNHIAEMLITPVVRNQLSDDMCNRSYLAQLHYNYS